MASSITLTKISGNTNPKIRLSVDSAYAINAQYPAKVTLGYKQNNSVTFYITSNPVDLQFPSMPTYTPTTVSFISNPDSYTTPTTSVKKGSTDKNAVRWVQSRLLNLGYSIGTTASATDVDGSFGEKTENAVRKFQSDNNLSVDGSVGSGTRAKLQEKWLEKYATYGDSLPAHPGYPEHDAALWVDTQADKTLVLTVQVETHNFTSDTDTISKQITLSLVAGSDSYATIDSVVFTPVNTSIPSATRSHFDGVAIQGVSTYSAQAFGSGNCGSYIKEAYLHFDETYQTHHYVLADGATPTITGGKETISFNIDKILTPGTHAIATTYIKNTKGFEKNNSVYTNISNLDVKRYSRPLLGGYTANRCDMYGSLKQDGEYVKFAVAVSFHTFNIPNDNTCGVQVQWQEEGTSSWSNWTEISSNTTSILPDPSTPSGVTFDKTKTYTFRMRAVDDVSSPELNTVYYLSIPTEDVPLHMAPGGKKIAIGKYCHSGLPEKTFECAWDAEFDEKVQADQFIGNSANIRELYINNSPIADHIVEWRSYSVLDSHSVFVMNWTFRKWASGMQEVWGTYPTGNFSITSGSKSGTLMGYGYLIDGKIKGFPTFNGNDPCIQLTFEGDEWVYPVLREFVDTGNNQELKVRICAIQAENVSGGYLHIYMIGHVPLLEEE